MLFLTSESSVSEEINRVIEAPVLYLTSIPLHRLEVNRREIHSDNIRT